MLSCPRVGQNLKILMENQTMKDKVHFHYEHNDSCKFSRWTARECYQYMYARPWQKVNGFYSDMVKGNISISDLFNKEMNITSHHSSDAVEDNHKSDFECIPTKDRTGRWARMTFKIILSYHGASFDGWQKQPGLNTVQGIVERSLGEFVDEKKATLLKEKKLPLEGCAVVAGRTDKGVTAFQQVCSFYTWRKDVKPQEIEDSINNAEPGRVRVISVAKVSREFHPNFSAKWRRYLYIFPFTNGDESELENYCHKDADCKNIFCTQDLNSNDNCERSSQFELDVDEDGIESGNKPTKFEVGKINQIMQQLEGKLLSYKMFARDTKASRNTGPPTECFVYHARAAEAFLPCAQDGNCTKVMCIELVANRFLRKMVRVLVATAVREAAAGANDDSLLKLMDATCRRATAPPAPPDGLCLVDVGSIISTESSTSSGGEPTSSVLSRKERRISGGRNMDVDDNAAVRESLSIIRSARLPAERQRRSRRRKISYNNNSVMKKIATSSVFNGCEEEEEEEVESKINALQKMVPGAESLALDKLFEETAGYILALQFQVKTLKFLTNLVEGSQKEKRKLGG